MISVKTSLFYSNITYVCSQKFLQRHNMHHIKKNIYRQTVFYTLKCIELVFYCFSFNEHIWKKHFYDYPTKLCFKLDYFPIFQVRKVYLFLTFIFIVRMCLLCPKFVSPYILSKQHSLYELISISAWNL